LDNLAWKCKAKEDKQKDAAKHRQAVTNASEQLVEAFNPFTTQPTNTDNVFAIMQ